MTDWQRPRPYTDASLRQHHYGPLEPMEESVFQFRPRFFLYMLPGIALAAWFFGS
jgi:hypothetical protein